MNFGQFVVSACLLVACIEAVPIHKRSTGSATAEFEMPVSSYDNYAWTTRNSNLTKESEDSQNAYSGGGISCPDTVLEGANVPVYRRSTCPWYYEADHVSTRYPTTILRAYPACSKCIGSNGSRQCEPIRRTLSVLEKGDIINGKVQFVEKDIEIAVGYTCAGAATVSNGTPAPPTGGLPDFAK